MEWTTPDELRIQVQRLWDKGRLLSAPLLGESLFPLRLRFRSPGSDSVGSRFDDVRGWIRKLESGGGYHLDWSEINHRTLGRNRIPSGATIECERDAFELIDKTAAAARFRSLAQETMRRFPVLADWVARRPLVVLERSEDWPRILDVVAWFQTHPKSGLYARQIDIAGVDTKFIETHKPLLAELLDIVADPDRNERVFERRYGLATKPALIRFRLLDEQLAIRGMADLSIPAADFASLQLPVSRVFIVENEINGLAFPELPGSVVIFGLGYGLDRLSKIGWLASCSLYYWGDIDTHGFAMLDRVREIFPGTRSFLMDRDTLHEHAGSCVREPAPYRGELRRLTDAERGVFDEIRSHGEVIRLEQELISYSCVLRALNCLTELG